MKTETLNNYYWIGIKNKQWSNHTDIYVDSQKLISFEHYTEIQRDEFDELIVTAVNSCKEINKDNPLAVAKLLPAMYASLQNVYKWHQEHFQISFIDSEIIEGVYQLLKQLEQ